MRTTLVALALLLFLAIPGQAQEKSTAPKSKTPVVAKGKTAPAGKEIGVIETTMGTIEIDLFRGDAPKTVENFVRLAEKKYYNGIIFHRVLKGFVIQGGDPTGSGRGGKSIYGKNFEDELDPNTPSVKEGYKHGVVAMANMGPNTNGSQFFIMLKDAPWMENKYTIFGKVIKGLDVVDKIGDVEITPGTDGRPKVDVKMKSVTIRREKAETKK
jgi:cyclophilin family peptidyl-prolyl cis-trans isomerase